MPDIILSQRVDGSTQPMKFDARPDRVDLRDREYQPRLKNLPPEYPRADFIRANLGEYVDLGLVLNQGREGACTGFGLAAVVNYLLWRKSREDTGTWLSTAPAEQPSKKLAGRAGSAKRAGSDISLRPQIVSARMLYELARRYDEWPGEDYSGSSCRGAMKGWHRHGVCTGALWPYAGADGAPRFIPPAPGWQDDAAARPLGAYYRVDKDSAVDLQSAVVEVGAIYVSAQVHSGWSSLADSDLGPSTLIGPKDPGKPTGGHAFAIVGYTARGFIVQNSWGPGWGYKGFGVLPYADWFEHAMDAWVAVLGAPMLAAPGAAVGLGARPERKAARYTPPPVRTLTRFNLQERAAGMGAYNWSPATTANSPTIAPPPLSDDHAYQLTVVLGNNGQVINQFVDCPDGVAAVEEAARALPRAWFASDARAARNAAKGPTLMIYAHGGLNSEEASMKRVRSLAPYFMEAGVYPLFITWKTGVLESIIGALQDKVARLIGVAPVEGVLDRIREALEEARDRTVEVLARNLGVRAVWSEMKQNAEAGADRGAGLDLIAGAVSRLIADMGASSPAIHLVGHSAGGILHGHLIGSLNRAGVGVKSCRLFAPACSVRFAADKYLPALARGKTGLGKLLIDTLSDRVERNDVVGSGAIYSKSLLYLVSRALEDVHKTPLLGMQAAWDNPGNRADQWNADLTPQLSADIQAFSAKGVKPKPRDENDAIVAPNRTIPRAHGSFDNDVETMRDAIKTAGGTLTDAHDMDSMDLRGF